MASINNHPSIIEGELPSIPLDQTRRHACLELALKWAEFDVGELDHDDIVKAAEAFERFIIGIPSPESYVCNRWPPGVARGSVPPADEQPQEPAKAETPKPIRAWISRDNRSGCGLDIFTLRPPVKGVSEDGFEVFASDDGGELFACGIDPDLLAIDLAPGEVQEIEITIRRLT